MPVGSSPVSRWATIMSSVSYLYWQEDDAWPGYPREFPDYWTRGETLDDLIEHLRDLYLDATSGALPGIRRMGELVIS